MTYFVLKINFSQRIGGSGQTCCYDDNKELIQTADTMYGGRPSRSFIYGKHPFKMRMMVRIINLDKKIMNKYN